MKYFAQKAKFVRQSTTNLILSGEGIKNELLVKAELPGLEPKDIEVNITGDLLAIKGEKKKR